MDKQQPNSENTAYTGRFADAKAAQARNNPPRPRKAAQETPRKPSGFSAAGQDVRKKNAPVKEEKQPEKKAKKPKKVKKEKKAKQTREKKSRRGLKALLCAVAAVLALLVIFVLIFGGDDKTYHQMPTVERISIAHFDPEETPLPGVEGT